MENGTQSENYEKNYVIYERILSYIKVHSDSYLLLF